MFCTASASETYAATKIRLLINRNEATVVIQICRPSEFVSNVIIGGGEALSMWDRDRDELH